MNLARPSILIMTALAAENVLSNQTIMTGLWEITTHSEAVYSVIPIVTDQAQKNCITELEPVPWSDNLTDNCSKEIISKNGDTVTWRVECKHGGSAKTIGSGSVIYSGDTLSGSATFHSVGGESDGLTTKQIIKGKRIGDCK